MKKFIAAILTFAMIAGMVPFAGFAAFADDEEDMLTPPPLEECIEIDLSKGNLKLNLTTYTYNGLSYSIKGKSYYHIYNSSGAPLSYKNFEAKQGKHKIILDNVEISAYGQGIINNDSEVSLFLKGKNSITAADNYAAIYVYRNATLHISEYEDSNFDERLKNIPMEIANTSYGSRFTAEDIAKFNGTLECIAGSSSAGIGANRSGYTSCGKIYIHSGYINAVGGKGGSNGSSKGSGIGSAGNSYFGQKQYIEISGGAVSAYAFDPNAAAIGGGSYMRTGQILINGGFVEALSGHIGIGGNANSKDTTDYITISKQENRVRPVVIAQGQDGGIGGNNVLVNIEGGVIYADAYRKGQDGGAGIGASSNCENGTINISGGEIYAHGKTGIGGSVASSSCGVINISGGNIEAKGERGAGIGGGVFCTAGEVNISGRDTRITATGTGLYSEADHMAGIGNNEFADSRVIITMTDTTPGNIYSNGYMFTEGMVDNWARPGLPVDMWETYPDTEEGDAEFAKFFFERVDLTNRDLAEVKALVEEDKYNEALEQWYDIYLERILKAEGLGYNNWNASTSNIYSMMADNVTTWTGYNLGEVGSFNWFGIGGGVDLSLYPAHQNFMWWTKAAVKVFLGITGYSTPDTKEGKSLYTLLRNGWPQMDYNNALTAYNEALDKYNSASEEEKASCEATLAACRQALDTRKASLDGYKQDVYNEKVNLQCVEKRFFDIWRDFCSNNWRDNMRLAKDQNLREKTLEDNGFNPDRITLTFFVPNELIDTNEKYKDINLEYNIDSENALIAVYEDTITTDEPAESSAPQETSVPEAKSVPEATSLPEITSTPGDEIDFSRRVRLDSIKKKTGQLIQSYYINIESYENTEEVLAGPSPTPAPGSVDDDAVKSAILNINGTKIRGKFSVMSYPGFGQWGISMFWTQPLCLANISTSWLGQANTMLKAIGDKDIIKGGMTARTMAEQVYFMSEWVMANYKRDITGNPNQSQDIAIAMLQSDLMLPYMKAIKSKGYEEQIYKVFTDSIYPDGSDTEQDYAYDYSYYSKSNYITNYAEKIAVDGNYPIWYEVTKKNHILRERFLNNLQMPISDQGSPSIKQRLLESQRASVIDINEEHGYRSIAFPWHGLYIFRNNTEVYNDNDETLYMALSSIRRGNGHERAGVNKIWATAYGTDLLVNQNYSKDENSTLSMNTVHMFNNNIFWSQNFGENIGNKRADVCQNYYYTSDKFDYANASRPVTYYNSSGTAITGVVHERKVEFVKEDPMWIVTDIMKPPADNTDVNSYFAAWNLGLSFDSTNVHVTNDKIETNNPNTSNMVMYTFCESDENTVNAIKAPVKTAGIDVHTIFGGSGRQSLVTVIVPIKKGEENPVASVEKSFATRKMIITVKLKNGKNIKYEVGLDAQDGEEEYYGVIKCNTTISNPNGSGNMLTIEKNSVSGGAEYEVDALGAKSKVGLVEIPKKFDWIDTVVDDKTVITPEYGFTEFSKPVMTRENAQEYVDISINSITLNFTRPVSVRSDRPITLKFNGKTYSLSDDKVAFNEDNTKATLTFADFVNNSGEAPIFERGTYHNLMIEQGTFYENALNEVDGAVYRLAVANEEGDTAETIAIDGVENNKVTASFANVTSAVMPATVVAAEYDMNGKLIGLQNKEVDSISQPVTIELASVLAGEAVKVMLVDNLENMKPYAKSALWTEKELRDEPLAIIRAIDTENRKLTYDVSAETVTSNVAEYIDLSKLKIRTGDIIQVMTNENNEIIRMVQIYDCRTRRFSSYAKAHSDIYIAGAVRSCKTAKLILTDSLVKAASGTDNRKTYVIRNVSDEIGTHFSYAMINENDLFNGSYRSALTTDAGNLGSSVAYSSSTSSGYNTLDRYIAIAKVRNGEVIDIIEYRLYNGYDAETFKEYNLG